MLIGMCYDNTVPGLGNWFITAPWYEAASHIRFLFHALVLPFLTLYGLSVLRAAGVRSAFDTPVTGFCWLFTLGALAWGLYFDLFLLELGPREAPGVLKLGDLSGAPPYATILTNVLALLIAARVWRASGWPWFFLGSAFIFLVNGARRRPALGFLRRQLRRTGVRHRAAGHRPSLQPGQ